MTESAHPPAMLRRIVDFPLVMMVVGTAATLLAAFLMGRLIEATWGGEYGNPGEVVQAILLALAAGLAYEAYRRWIERDAPPDLSPGARGIGGLLGGLAFGAVLFSAIAGCVMLLGGMEIVNVNLSGGGLYTMIGIAITSGVIEEIVFRGVLFRQLERLGGSWVALGVTALLFGILHITNPNATWLAALAISMEAGIMLGAVYMLTRNLWAPIGIHAAWNFTQGYVFSIPVSGTDTPPGLFITRRVGADWLTGGAFGLEASLVAVVIATAAGIGFLVLTVRRGEIRPRRWPEWKISR